VSATVSRDIGRPWRGRLVVDAVFFQDWTTGIARVWREVLLEWASRGFASQVLIVDRVRTAPRIAGYSYIDAPRYEFADDAAEQNRLGQLCRQVKADAFASSYYTIAAGVPNLLVLHDMIPERVGEDLNVPMWRQKQRAIAAAAGFACVSQNTLRDFQELYVQAAKRPTVLAPNGVKGFSPPTEEEAAAFRKNFCALALGGRPHVMFINGGGGIKNGSLLKRALTLWPERKRFSLLVTTPPQHAVEWYPLVPGMVFSPTYFSDHDLRLAYGTAYCLVHPSIYEGFGLAVLEALACGCPVIASNTSSQPEVAGDAALYINPYDAEGLVKALDEIGKPERREKLRRRGLERAAEFTWSRSVQALESLLHQIAPTPSIDDR